MNRPEREDVHDEAALLVDVALIHHPVINKGGDVIGSAVTNLDIHDIARASRTFGVDNYFVVTPYPDQQDLVHEILNHWQTGYGAHYNPARASALDRVRVTDSMDTLLALVTEKRGRRPLVITTSARVQEKSVSYQQVRADLATGMPILLLFGTAHGLAPAITERADYTLPPIESRNNSTQSKEYRYNHLSVRSAVAIILDRLLGVREG